MCIRDRCWRQPLAEEVEQVTSQLQNIEKMDHVIVAPIQASQKVHGCLEVLAAAYLCTTSRGEMCELTIYAYRSPQAVADSAFYLAPMHIWK